MGEDRGRGKKKEGRSTDCGIDRVGLDEMKVKW